MEYLIGAALAFIGIVAIRYFEPRENRHRLSKIRYSQSHIFHMLGPFASLSYPQEDSYKELDTQSTRFFDSRHQRMLLLKDKAYWIRGDAVYEANIVDGGIDESSAQVVDMMAMDSVELDEMVFIVDKLNEGRRKNDSGSSGQS